jgi:phosphoribosylamine--glycine ligase
MRVLLVGGGGREHALAWRLKRDQPSIQLFAAPGNPGIADLGTCLPIDATDFDGILAFARRESVSFTVVGPEAPLAAGIVDRFRANGLPIFGPTAAAAEIETSKAFSKALMERAGVPTGAAVICRSIDDARHAIARFGAPVVVKASGLAAGKGVIVCQTLADAHRAVDMMLKERLFGDAGNTVLVEEFLSGEELSVFVLTDGERVVPLIPAQDHKRLLDGDLGPNTGGMGAYAPVSVVGDDPRASPLIEDVLDRIISPTLTAMREAGRPFTGLLYAGLILTGNGPKVIEFNCRFGDPETQAVLPILDSSPQFFSLVETIARGDRLPTTRVTSANTAVTTVVAAEGYPESPRTGTRIYLPPPPDNVIIFHSGTRRDEDGHLVASGGRVLSITGVAPSLENAAQASQAYAGAVDFEGKQFRRDIGWRELARSREQA